jgi:predicted nuclease of restriction endonuclease-like (RecB) superfamily
MELEKSDYASFLVEIKDRIRESQYRAMRSVNKELVDLYRDIGKSICQQQDSHGWGKAVVSTLASDLQLAFPGRNGFSARNLWNMREFYLAYRNNSKLLPLVAEISWSKNLLIMTRCKDDLECEFYLRSTARFGWTKAVLQHQIDNNSYVEYLANQTNFDETLTPEIRNQAVLAVKDHYTFDFLGLAEKHSERELEAGLINNLRSFLVEMGGAFTYVGNQHRLEIGGQEYFIDLLLFHRKLRSLVAIELKIGEFKPEYKGKMEFYLEALADKECYAEENPPIGIIICRTKNKTVVEYSLRTASRPIGVASYTTVQQLPVDFRDQLPSPEEIARRMLSWEVKIDESC